MRLSSKPSLMGHVISGSQEDTEPDRRDALRNEAKGEFAPKMDRVGRLDDVLD